jgi:1,4-dihydroxy-2-naphthoate polyprenyltransferase
MHILRQFIAFIKLGRFLFLIGGFVMYNLGVAIARYQGVSLDWTLYLWGQVAVTSTQLMVHYSNDYYDYAGDLLNDTYTPWSGGSRILPNGELPRSAALYGALFFGGCALVVSFILTALTSPATLVLLLITIFLSWNYSSPPLHLHRQGLGEFTAAGIVAVLTPLLGYYLQAGKIDPLLLMATLPLALLEFNMLLSVHLPDAEADALAGKKTLAVRFGRDFVTRIYALLLILVYGLLPMLLMMGLPFEVALVIALPLPVAAFLLLKTATRQWGVTAHFSHLAFLTISLLMVTATLQALAFILISS